MASRIGYIRRHGFILPKTRDRFFMPQGDETQLMKTFTYFVTIDEKRHQAGVLIYLWYLAILWTERECRI